MTNITRDQFEEAYLLWAAATEKHNVMMAKTMAGKPLDVDLMHQKIVELELLHEDWMAKSRCFVHWKP